MLLEREREREREREIWRVSPREQVDNVWKACVRSQRKDPQLIQDDMEIVSVESIKGIGCKELFVCVIGDFIVLPGPVWVGMKMTTALKGRMTSTRHVTSFHNAVTAIKDDGYFTDKTAVNLVARWTRCTGW